MHIKDLGTEFGIISADSADDEVHLLKGEIEITSLNALKEEETLSTPQARSFTPTGRLLETDLKKEAFTKELPAESDSIIVFQDTFAQQSNSAWEESGASGRFKNDYLSGNCSINTQGKSDHSLISFDQSGKEIPATDKGYMSLGYTSRAPVNSVKTAIRVQEGRTYTIYFRHAGSHNGTQKIRATMSLGTTNSSTGKLSCPDKAWASASFTFTPTSSGIATLTFDDTGSTEHHDSDPLLDSVIVISRRP